MVLLTSCLSGAAHTELLAPHTDATSPDARTQLPDAEQHLLTLSLQQIVDEFFSPADLFIAPANAMPIGMAPCNAHCHAGQVIPSTGQETCVPQQVEILPATCSSLTLTCVNGAWINAGGGPGGWGNYNQPPPCVEKCHVDAVPPNHAAQDILKDGAVTTYPNGCDPVDHFCRNPGLGGQPPGWFPPLENPLILDNLNCQNPPPPPPNSPGPAPGPGPFAAPDSSHGPDSPTSQPIGDSPAQSAESPPSPINSPTNSLAESPPQSPGDAPTYDSPHDSTYESFYESPYESCIDSPYDSPADSPDSPADSAIYMPARDPDRPYEKALPFDYRYRDICVAGADLNQGQFDPKTGLLKEGADEEMIPGEAPPDSAGAPDSAFESPTSVFDIPFVGNVNGARPPANTCMPMKDTNITPVGATPNGLFAAFLNMDDRSLIGQFTSPDAYGKTNYFASTTFMIGGVSGCPDILDYPAPPPMQRNTTSQRANFRRYQADNCYNYYILNHSVSPWFALEVPGEQTRDPLTRKMPDKSILNNCQPLIRGDVANAIQFSKPKDRPDEMKFGFAPVYWYNLATHDEAEYLLSDYLKKTWDAHFYNNPFPYKLKTRINKGFGVIPLPCIQEPGAWSPPVVVFPAPPPESPADSPNHPPMCQEAPPDSPAPPDSAADSPKDSPGESCPVPYAAGGGYPYYTSRGKADPYYCPNVEKITEPGHPFSPRHDIVRTDRDYSSDTSIPIPKDPKTCAPLHDEYAFSDWNVPGARSSEDKQLYPIVQCGIVPVDILSFRAGAFDSCIRERISYDYNLFIESWILQGWSSGRPYLMKSDESNNPTYMGGRPLPCKLRFYDTDTSADCPVKMSIQQCCRIIVKDVVPANFLKIRTCEGLREKRMNRFNKLNIQDPYSTGQTSSYDNPNVNLPIGATAYEQAVTETKQLNEEICDDTEPSDYQFKSHFGKFVDPTDSKLIGYHMPYMRWWDTGVSAGQKYHGGSFVNTLGGFDTLIGVGREERTYQDVQDADNLASKTNAPSDKMQDRSAPRKAEMGRWGGWSELKAHEMWSIRRNNLFCVGRYEKLFKPGDAESLALAMGGSNYTTPNSVSYPWSLGWRGYASDSHGRQFPRAFGTPSATSYLTGLDNVLQGDIIVYQVNGVPHTAYVSGIDGYALAGSDVPLPYANPSTEFNPNTGHFEFGGQVLHPTRINIHSWDDGKFPTSTGNSIMWGMGPERTIYKDMVPDSYHTEICTKTLRALTNAPGSGTQCSQNVANNSLTAVQCFQWNCQPSCEDPDYSACVLPSSGAGASSWDNARIYRPDVDTNLIRCPLDGMRVDNNDPDYNLQDTYDWAGPTYRPDVDTLGNPIGVVNPASLPGPTVISQSASSKIFADTWAYCVNAGYDPPRFWSKGYLGPQTGAMTYTALCGPKWWVKPPTPAPGNPAPPPDPQNGCSAATNIYKFYPQGTAR